MFNKQNAAVIVKKEGRTAEWLAQFCRCNKATIQGYFTGAIKPSRPMVRLLSMALNCSESDLLNAESDNESDE